jgi:putative ABC transport system substrate-binding protein
MRRREFITLLGSAVAAEPLSARAQQPTVPVIGLLHPASLSSFEALVAAFRQGLKETGYTEGRNVAIEYRWADGHEDRLPELAAGLVRQQVAVIATPGSTPATLAAKAATASIPIVFAVGLDPVELGLVTSLGSPGGNLTGVAMLALEMTVKQLELLAELVPSAAMIAILRNPNNPGANVATTNLNSAADKLGRQILFLDARSDEEIEGVLSTMQAGALLVLPDAFFISRRGMIAALAARTSTPSIYQRREFLEVGGLASYGEHYPDTWRQVGVYVGRILSGAKPVDLPVLQPRRFHFVINLKSAKALGLTVPPPLLALADEVIE